LGLKTSPPKPVKNNRTEFNKQLRINVFIFISPQQVAANQLMKKEYKHTR